MLDVKFLAAGSNAEEAMSFICKLSFNLINESKGKQKIDIRCQNIDEAIKLDSELWINPKDSFMPHNLSNNRSEEDIIEIGYPGTNSLKIIIRFLLILTHPFLTNSPTIATICKLWLKIIQSTERKLQKLGRSSSHRKGRGRRRTRRAA